jgi:hypothetical protein
VMGAGGGEAEPAAQGRGAKPAPPDHARAEEPKREPGKPGESVPATARLQPPASDEQKRPGDVPSVMQERGRKPAAGGRFEPTTASRGQQRQDTEGKPQEPPREVPNGPAHEAAEPSTVPAAAAPESGPAPAAPVPGNADSGEGAPVPRDNIPD